MRCRGSPRPHDGVGFSAPRHRWVRHLWSCIRPRVSSPSMPRPILATVHADALTHNLARARYAAGDARVWADLAHVLFNSKEFIFVR